MGFDLVRDGTELVRPGFEQLGYSGYEEHVMLEPGMQWIDEAGGRPFFAVFQTQAPHHDFRTPSWFTPTRYTDADDEFDRYLNTLRYVDGFLADLFAAFEERGLAESTAFILVGDHGEAFGEHGFRYHANAVWEEVIQVPLLIYAPGRVEAGTLPGAHQQIDVLPTVAELLGLRAEGGVLPGRSLLRAEQEDRLLYFSAAAPNQFMALREGNLKFVYTFRRVPMQVYDLAADSLEQDDLAAGFSERHLEAVELRLLLWRRQVNASYETTPDER
jgi:arylsulfatase A-like enzyme